MLKALFKPSPQPPTLEQQVMHFFVGLGMLGVIAWLDVMSGRNVHLGLLYPLPVGIVAWFSGRRPAYALSIVAIACWRRFSEPAVDFNSGPVIELANLAIRLVYYPAVIEALARLRDVERRLETQVAARTSELRAQITVRERAEAAQRQLAIQLSEAEDAERRKIAYDIHDALSQMLGVIKLNLETAVAESPTDSRQYERLTDVVRVVNDLIRQTRELTFDLHPSMLDDLGLVPTLRGFGDEFHRRTMAEVTVSEAGENKKMPSPLASYLFRSVKELVSNSVRHGNAKEIQISVHWENGGVRIVVDDDGSGFDTQAVGANGRRGLGLAGIDERMASLGGMLRLESQPGQGARVILETPLPAQSDGHTEVQAVAKTVAQPVA